jgi:hypothetical protein
MFSGLFSYYYCTCCLYGVGRNDFDAGSIHRKGLALKIKTFLGHEITTMEASVILAQKSTDFFSGPTTANGPSNGFARIKIIKY